MRRHASVIAMQTATEVKGVFHAAVIAKDDAKVAKESRLVCFVLTHFSRVPGCQTSVSRSAEKPPWPHPEANNGWAGRLAAALHSLEAGSLPGAPSLAHHSQSQEPQHHETWGETRNQSKSMTTSMLW